MHRRQDRLGESCRHDRVVQRREIFVSSHLHLLVLAPTDHTRCCSKQAFTGIQKKYAGTYVGGANATNGNGGDKATKPKTTPKKRAANDGVVKGSGRKKVKKEETPEGEVEDDDGVSNGDEVETGDVED